MHPHKMTLDPARPWSAFAPDAFLKGGKLHGHLLKLAALSRGCTVDLIGDNLFLVSAPDGRTTCYSGRATPVMGIVAHRLAGNKIASAALMQKQGVQTPNGKVFGPRQLNAAVAHFKSLGFPAVVKPIEGSGGAGVTVNILDQAHFRAAWEEALKISRRGVIVERFISGRDYRVFVIGDKVVAAARRHPANITGDGRHTVAELLDLKSAERAAIPYVGDKTLVLTPAMIRRLEEAGRTPQHVLDKGEVWQLHEVANIGAGGDSEDVTALIHPDFVEIAIRARQFIPGMGYAGVDLLAADISLPQDSQDWAICEINSSPEFALHHFPGFGQGRDVAGALIEHALGMTARDAASASTTVHIRIDGKVTGVGYRRWLQRQAQAYNLQGWVANTADSAVEAVLHGPKGVVAAVSASCRKGPKIAKPRSVSVIAETDEAPDWAGFAVRPDLVPV
ncbi:acylphosphatase [Paracoccus jeotgali]|uniref:acylphosphatase n=1 Tax=Paracoccus jeotgali TaxID=2065379 RepID=UPI0028A63AF9|nr:acylphosphatase [Paracoccus jeotgali]